MDRIAFLFSGQGAQYPGMGKDFYNKNRYIKEIFEMAEKYRTDTLFQCFESDSAVLKETENTQPCLYLADLTAAIALERSAIRPDAVAGFSLGEIPALAFAGAFSYLDGFKIACKRGELMGEANKKAPANMVAVLKLENSQIESICKIFKHVYPVNYNCTGQLVVAGLKEELILFENLIKSAGGRTLKLNVSGGFHSPFMDSAASKFGKFLENINISEPDLPVYSNFTTLTYSSNVKELMQNQINNPLKWQHLITNMIKDGINTFVEVGVGNTLQKLVTKISPDAKCISVENMDGVAYAIKELRQIA
ncbi:MAG: ACP S-malonyltransferase [Clostridiales bacterium]|nr:ACP S-malonyltransferase [Clostridiales bacterium]